MRVAINCRSFLSKQYTGIGRYAYHLVRSLSEIDSQNDYSLYCRKNIFDLKRQVPQVPGRNFSLKVDWLDQGLGRTLGPVDIYHSPSPDYISLTKCKIIVTVHDLIYKTFPEGHTPETIATSDRQFQNIIKKASRIICVSQNTKKDLIKHFGVDEKRLAMVYQGVDKKTFYPMSAQEQGAARETLEKKGLKEPFVLFVGTLEPRKNLKNLLAAFAQLKKKKQFPGKLVVIGMRGWMSTDIAPMVVQLGLTEEVLFLGYVTNEQLRFFYSEAQVFVFPSFYEGFGFPIVEAFSCGAPVVTSNVSSCPEIAGNAALLVNPKEPKEIAEAIRKVHDDAKLRQELKDKALKRAKDFSFLNTAMETLRVYQEVYSMEKP